MKLKKYNQFIKESLGIRLDHEGKPRCTAFDGGVEHGDIDYIEVENLKPNVVDEFIEEIKRCIEINHEVLATDLSNRLDSAIKEVFGDDYNKWYLKPIDTDKESSKFTFYPDDLSLAFAKLINLGYSIGYVTEKYSTSRSFRFSKFFGYDGEVFTGEKDFKKVSSNPLDYRGPDISHHSLLASSFDIKTSLSPKNIQYGEEDQGNSEISTIFSKPFAYGYDAGAKMVDLERDLYYEKIGTTYDRYHDLIMIKDKTPEEEKEYKDIRRKADIIIYGEDYVTKQDQERKDFDALPKEEQERRRKINKEKMAKFLKDLDLDGIL